MSNYLDVRHDTGLSIASQGISYGNFHKLEKCSFVEVFYDRFDLAFPQFSHKQLGITWTRFSVTFDFDA